MGTGGLSTQNLCQVECMPHDVNTNIATQDTTTCQVLLVWGSFLLNLVNGDVHDLFYRANLTRSWYNQHYFHHFLHDLWQRDIYNLLRNSFLGALLRHKLNHLHCLLHCLDGWYLTLHHNWYIIKDCVEHRHDNPSRLCEIGRLVAFTYHFVRQSGRDTRWNPQTS